MPERGNAGGSEPGNLEAMSGLGAGKREAAMAGFGGGSREAAMAGFGGGSREARGVGFGGGSAGSRDAASGASDEWTPWGELRATWLGRGAPILPYCEKGFSAGTPLNVERRGARPIGSSGGGSCDRGGRCDGVRAEGGSGIALRATDGRGGGGGTGALAWGVDGCAGVRFPPKNPNRSVVAGSS
jgi:hypothetical protein